MSNIEWTGETWNPIVGCSLASPGCTNCYAMPMAARLEAMATRPDGTGNVALDHYKGLTKYSRGGPVWTGTLALSESALSKPLKRKSPQTYFVNSMGDLFHEDCPDEWIDRIFAIMALCPQHTFQILTKRSRRMREYLGRCRWHKWAAIGRAVDSNRWAKLPPIYGGDCTPMPNVWPGVSVEDQRRAVERIPDLLATPAAVRWISAEPLLEGIYVSQWMHDSDCWLTTSFDADRTCTCSEPREDGLDWVVVGGESGPGARPFEAAWARSIRDQCASAGVPFFMKQMGGAVKSRLPAIPADLMVREMPKASS